MSQPTRDLDELGPDPASIARAPEPGTSPGRRLGLWRLIGQLNRVAAGENVLPELAREVRLVTGFDLVLVERYDPMEHRVRLVAHAGVELSECDLELPGAAGETRTLFGVQLGEAVFFEPVSGHARLGRALPGPLRVETLCSAPIRCGDQRLGALSVGARRPIEEDGGLREILQGVADHLGAAWSASLLLDLSREHSRLEHAARAGWVLAHELRNPLHTVSLQLASLRHGLSALPAPLRRELERGLESVQAETVRLHDLLQHYLRLGRQRPGLRRSRILLRDLLDGVLRFYQLSLQHTGIAVEVDLPDEPIPVYVDVAQLCQVFHNLLRNALDAMPHGGRLTVSVRCTTPTLEIELRDTGPGIQDPEAALAFFASTRPGGTGLGLPVSREILRAHGGDLVLLPSTSGASLLLSLPSGEPEG